MDGKIHFSKKKGTSHHSSLPPQKRHSGQVSKPFIIGLVSLGAVIVLVLLLFFASQFVGKAYTLPANLGGHEVNGEVVREADGTQKIAIEALLQEKNILTPEGGTARAPTEVNGIYLELSSTTAGYNPCSAESGGAWQGVLNANAIFHDLTCQDGKLIVADAALDNVLSGTFPLVKLNEMPQASPLNLLVNKIDVYDAETGADLFPPPHDSFPLTITLSPCTIDDEQDCGTDEGECTLGKQVCAGVQGAGAWSPCAGAVGPSREVCNNKDDDCDGVKDEEASGCAAGETCVSGVCVLPEVPSGGGGPSGGGHRCSDDWKCGNWGFCGKELKQNRTCINQNYCTKPYQKVETRACSPCAESWICSLWSACQNGLQRRKCSDERSCGTYQSRPREQKSCAQQVVPGPQPIRIVETIPPSTPAVIQQPVPPSLWKQYQSYIVGGIGGLLLIGILALLIIHFRKNKGVKVYNFDELVDWMKKEKEIGAADEEIKKIISENTGWNAGEVEQAFRELSKAQPKGSAVVN